MSDQLHLEKPDTRTDAQKFEDAMRCILRAPKKEVMAQLAAEKQSRQQKVTAKQK